MNIQNVGLDFLLAMVMREDTLRASLAKPPMQKMTVKYSEIVR